VGSVEVDADVRLNELGRVDIVGNQPITRVAEAECRIEIEAEVRTVGRSGVEMDSLTAVSVAGLTVYDMCKAVDREMVISDVRLIKKVGGKSGAFTRGECGADY